jgi:hypothetical protein
MTTSGASISSPPLAANSAPGPLPGSVSVAAAQAITIPFYVEDVNGNPMAAGTTVTVTADSTAGTVTGPGANWTIGCRSGGGPADGLSGGGDSLFVTLTGAGTAGGTTTPSGNVTITVTSPQSKTSTVAVIQVN